MLAERSPQPRQTVGVLMELSVDERIRMLFEEREKTRLDIVSMMGGAERKGSYERALTIARNLLKMDMPIDKIVEATGLTYVEIEALLKAN